MRRVSSRLPAVFVLAVLLLAPSASADTGSAEPSLWEQFLVWTQGRIDVPTGAASEDLFEEWLVLMGRIGIPTG